MVTKPKYNINVRTDQPWKPFVNEGKQINNRGSVSHNIINHEPNLVAPNLVLGLMDKQVTNRKKGIGEFGDLQRPTAMNPNQQHLKAY